MAGPAQAVPTAPKVPTVTVFGTFSTAKSAGATVDIRKDVLIRAVKDALQLSDTADTKSLAVFNLAQLYGFRYDFHLSFKCDDSGTWAKDAHFCARNEAMGKNACFYWFYKLTDTAGTLAWSFEGTAPINESNKDLVNPIGITNVGGGGAAQRLAAHSANDPLVKILAQINRQIGKGKLRLVGGKVLP